MRAKSSQARRTIGPDASTASPTLANRNSSNALIGSLSRRFAQAAGQFLQPLQHPLAEAARHFLGHDVAELAQQRGDLFERDDVGAAAGVALGESPLQGPGRRPPILLLGGRVADALQQAQLGGAGGLPQLLREGRVAIGRVLDGADGAADVGGGHGAAAPHGDDRQDLALLRRVEYRVSAAFAHSYVSRRF